MAMYANQKTCIIKREPVAKNTKEVFLCIYERNLKEAMKDLNGATFKLYICLMTNADGYRFDISPQYIENEYGISKSSAHRALKELEEKGYIKQVANNSYELYETPQVSVSAQPDNVIQMPKRANEETIDCSVKTLPKENNNIPTFLRRERVAVGAREPVNYLDGVNWDE